MPLRKGDRFSKCRQCSSDLRIVCRMMCRRYPCRASRNLCTAPRLLTQHSSIVHTPPVLTALGRRRIGLYLDGSHVSIHHMHNYCHSMISI
ncbi:hypothetical protein CDAR_314731 [Caerostris darwini]|uniref:Uncharacterized protein n=1 Tax=Caerostris darwini TaxID=1538125 RepID=A0AAV4TUM5_9ARAC|nr:hypothetical protein CDAR_314731 [Caerostris darwini]